MIRSKKISENQERPVYLLIKSRYWNTISAIKFFYEIAPKTVSLYLSLSLFRKIENPAKTSTLAPTPYQNSYALARGTTDRSQPRLRAVHCFAKEQSKQSNTAQRAIRASSIVDCRSKENSNGRTKTRWGRWFLWNSAFYISKWMIEGEAALESLSGLGTAHV